jgi:hypothetical protein
MPNLKKAELIEGVVYVPSPIRFDHHCNPHFNLIAWLGPFVPRPRRESGGDNGTAPDLDNGHSRMRSDRHAGMRRAAIDADDYSSRPEFVAVSPPAASATTAMSNTPIAATASRIRRVACRGSAIDWFELRGGFGLSRCR